MKVGKNEGKEGGEIGRDDGREGWMKGGIQRVGKCRLYLINMVHDCIAPVQWCTLDTAINLFQEKYKHSLSYVHE